MDLPLEEVYAAARTTNILQGLIRFLCLLAKEPTGRVMILDLLSNLNAKVVS